MGKSFTLFTSTTALTYLFQIFKFVNGLVFEQLISDNTSQNRVGSKFGGGGVAGASETNVDRRERLRKLALETIDLAKVRFRSSLPIEGSIEQCVLGPLYPPQPSRIARMSSLSNTTYE